MVTWQLIDELCDTKRGAAGNNEELSLVTLVIAGVMSLNSQEQRQCFAFADTIIIRS